MTVYVLVQLKMTDRAPYDRYQVRFFDVFKKFSGRLLAADENPAILEAAVVGIPDPALTSRLKAFATLKPGETPSDELATRVRQQLRSVIAPYKVPQEIEFLTDLPKTATGKILRRQLRARG